MLETDSLIGLLNGLSESARKEILDTLDEDDVWAFEGDWRSWAHPQQRAPAGDWRVWLFLGGRGAGKTRAGSEWVLEQVRNGRAKSVALVGATYTDVRGVMIEGPSGLLPLARYDHAFFEPSKRRVTWPGGAVAHVFTAEEPDGIRGYQFDAAWCDEFAKWNNAERTLDMLQMALRVGEHPRAVVTTTPRAVPALKILMAGHGVEKTHASTYANAANLAPAFIAQMEAQYKGTRLGRQELDAELIEDNDRALWKREWIERERVNFEPSVIRIVIGVDPPVGVGEGADECGIVVVGKDHMGNGWVLADRSARGLTPLGWATRVAEAHRRFRADAIIAEANQGGHMVEAVLRQVMPNAAIRLVYASHGKRTRAEPAAALYERGLIAHCGLFLELEDQLCQYDGAEGSPSPDRMDALVWALADLFPPDAPGEPKVRSTN